MMANNRFYLHEQSNDDDNLYGKSNDDSEQSKDDSEQSKDDSEQSKDEQSKDEQSNDELCEQSNDELYLYHIRRAYWTIEKIQSGITNEIHNICNTLLYASANPADLCLKERIKWLIELKIKVINNERCKYCNLPLQKSEISCSCKTLCSICNTSAHKTDNCLKHIMNSNLLITLFNNTNIKQKIKNK